MHIPKTFFKYEEPVTRRNKKTETRLKRNETKNIGARITKKSNTLWHDYKKRKGRSEKQRDGQRRKFLFLLFSFLKNKSKNIYDI